MYISFRKIDSYQDLPIRVIIGARGIGKTFGVKKKFIKNFIYSNKKFIWLRDNEDAIEKLSSNNGEKFFNDIRDNFNGVKFSIKNNAIFINEMHAGYLMSTSTYYNYKGNAYEDIENICFDEFIKEKAQRNTKNRIIQFINTIETIGRTRTNYKIYMLANALDRNDDFFDLFKIKIDGFGLYKNKKKGIILWYAKNNPVYDETHKNSISGRLTADTVYDDSINNNIFMGDDNIYFNKKPPKSKLYIILHDGENRAIRLYINNGIIYIENDKDENQYIDYRFVSKGKYVTSKTKTININVKKYLIEMQNSGKIRYNNGLCFSIFNDFLS